MAANDKLEFKTLLSGTEDVHSKLRGMQESIKDFGVTGTNAFKSVATSLGSAVDSLKKFLDLSKQVQQSTRDSFGGTQSSLARSVQGEIGLIKERDQLLRGNGMASGYMGNQMPGVPVFGGGGGGGFAGGPGGSGGGSGGGGGSWMGFAGGFARGMGLPGAGLMAGMGPIGAGLIAGQMAWSGTQYLATGEAREQAAERSYRVLEGQEALHGNVTRRLLRQQGIGPESEYLSGKLSSQFVAQNIELAVRQMFGLLQAKSPEQTRFEYIRTLSERGKEAEPGMQLWSDYQQAVRTGVDRPATMFGRTGTARNLRFLADQGIDLKRAAPLMNLMAQFGGEAGGGDADFALAQERFGIGQSMVQQIARRNAFGRRTGGGAGGMDETLQFLGRAGLVGPNTMPARDILSNYVGQYMSQYGTLGGGNVADFGANVANMQVAAQAASGGAAPADIAALTVQTAAGYRNRMDTPRDPLRQMMLATLIGQGLNPMEAEYFAQRDLTNKRTQTDLNTVLSGRQGKNVDSGKILGGTFRSMEGMYTNAIGSFLGSDVKATDPNAALRMTYNERGELVAPKAAAARNIFDTTTGGGQRAERGLETWEDTYRKEQAKTEATMAGGLAEKDSAVLKAIAGSGDQTVTILSKLLIKLDPKAVLPGDITYRNAIPFDGTKNQGAGSTPKESVGDWVKGAGR